MPFQNPKSTLNSHLREEALNLLSTEEWDLAIIGGGITGSGIALDAASRGMKVCLLEKGDFASGTSSRSTRLIHGGLRYLRNFEFGIVRETGRERRVIHHIAPHLVWPEPMLLPIVKGGLYGKLGLWFGLWLYDKLAGVKKPERRKILNAQQALATEPLLNKEKLKGAGLYREYHTDDARLTLSLIKTAVEQGACCLNYCKVESLIHENGKVNGLTGKEFLTGAEIKIRAKVVVNAAGPWVMDWLKEEGTEHSKKIIHSRGCHIVIPKNKINLRHPVYFDAGEGRMIFAIPSGETVYAGTTDEEYKGDLDHPRFTKSDAEYILTAINSAFNVKLGLSDVIAGWAGLRPLIAQEGKPTKDISRKDEILHSPSGLITIAGGKLTGYRKMAERVVNEAAKRLSGQTFSSCKTDALILSDSRFKANQPADEYAKALCIEFPEFDKSKIKALVQKYGLSSHGIISLARSLFSPGRNPAQALLVAEWRYCISNEACCTLSDFLIRRTHTVYEGNAAIEEKIKMLQDVLKELPEGGNANMDVFNEYLLPL